MDAIYTFGRRQDSTSGNLMYPNRQGNTPSGAKTRREIIEEMLAANSFLLSETEMKKVYSMFNIKDPPNFCIQDPFKDTAEDCHARYVSGTEEPGIMTETFARECNLSKFAIDNTRSSSWGDISNEIENRNERNQFSRETLDVNPFIRQKSPFILERGPLNCKRNSLERNDNHRDATNMSWERKSLSNPYKPGRIDHYEDPFKHTNYAISRIRKRKHGGREFPEVYGETSWNYDEESTNKQAKYEEENLNGRYLSATRQPETMAGSFSRQESDMHSGGSPYDRASNSYGQIPSYEMNTFGGERSQVHRETRGRSPFGSGRNDIHPETHRRSSSASERSSFGRKLREISTPTSERNLSSYELGESPVNREINSLDRNRSSDNLRDVRNMSRERRTRVDERIDFIPPRDNPYEPDRIELYQDASHYPGEYIATSSSRDFGGDSNAFMDSRNSDYSEGDDIDSLIDKHEPHYFRDMFENEGRSAPKTPNEIKNNEEKIIVVPQGFPFVRFTKDETKVLKRLLGKQAEDIIQQGLPCPKLRSGMYQGGSFVLKIKDQYTKDWLKFVIPRLQMETGQILQIGDYGDIPEDSKIKVVMWIPKGISSGPPMSIVKKLAEQNAGLVTNHWRVLNVKRNPQKASRFLLRIKQSDVTALQKFDMKPILHKKKTKFVIQG
ncbi:uncharacterized protein [Diabrotica undecimpunctata]|uniref:uncharacterized protein n=1 Tax=Diabrotica undecimpunctata TaxID=50387 RepID=UPI003B63F8CD